VIPLTADGDVVMVRQYRHGSREVTLEIPGGMVDPGETPAAAAARELNDHLCRLARSHTEKLRRDRVEALGADCVSLVTTEASAGTAYLMDPVSPAFEDSAFSALGSGIASHVLAHEVGHNVGLNHNDPPGAASASSAFCYSFGYRTPDDAWRSVMSSSPGTQAFLFSSPALTVGGFPFGVAGSGCPLMTRRTLWRPCRRPTTSWRPSARQSFR
jgi:hypothetical protein